MLLVQGVNAFICAREWCQQGIHMASTACSGWISNLEQADIQGVKKSQCMNTVSRQKMVKVLETENT